MNALQAAWRLLWAGLRGLSGDDAYDRYLSHLHACHAGTAPLGRRAFYEAELDRRWKQVNRCC